MTKSWNRALSVFLVAMMVISMLPTMAFAADEAHVHDHESEAAGGIELLAEGGTYNFQNWEIAVSASGDTCVPGVPLSWVDAGELPTTFPMEPHRVSCPLTGQHPTSAA